MQAIVLAGGLGTRLRGVVPDLPKPMAAVAGRPFLAWVLDPLVEAGFEQVVLAVGYRHEAIHAHFGTVYRGLPLRYSAEDQPLGTGGAIRLAAGGLGTQPIFVLNGDTYLDLDYAAMADAHRRSGASLSVAVCEVPDVGRYGALALAEGHIVGFLEKGGTGPGLINAGTYLLAADIVQHIPEGVPFSFEQQLLVPRLHEIRPAAFVAAGRFVDIGVPQDYARAQQLFASPRTGR
jgi:D-glycero-alpha-D-manno-heptose 1-phosphate guanylyltransferase